MERTKSPDVQAPEQEVTERKASEPTVENSGQEDEAVLSEAVLQPYAVAFKGGLRLRQEPRLDAPIITELPCGAGVYADGESGPDGWLHVLTGKLSGWMMSEYLEALPLPELGDGAG